MTDQSKTAGEQHEDAELSLDPETLTDLAARPDDADDAKGGNRRGVCTYYQTGCTNTGE